jgi:peptidoglycan glycosyltransferase
LTTVAASVNDGGVIAARAPRPYRRRASRRRRLLTRAAPLLVLAMIAFVAGARVAGGPGRSERRTAARYLTAWTHGDIASMYALLDPESRARVSETAFAAQLAAARATATARSISLDAIRHVGNGSATVIMTVHTRLWGTLRETLQLPFTGSGSGAHVHLQSSMLFPGLRPGESLSRRTRMPARAALLAADGTPLAEGPDRTSPIASVAGEVVGTLGSIPFADAAHDIALGYPAGAKVGQDGLERTFQDRLAGTPGGTLVAGSRVLARATPIAAAAVRTTIDPSLESAAIGALGGRYAGMAVMDPRTGSLEALAGLAYDAPQPPGSTMKIVTSTGVLQDHLAKLTTEFPEQSGATIDGYTMQNASGEVCGGTLLNAFAVSCNSVFAPLGVTLGARRLVATARRYGFDHSPSIVGADESTIPSAATIGSALAVGSSAIGQGKVLATPLEMVDVTATIADGGRRPIPTLLAGDAPRYVHVTTREVAGEIQQMMVAVISYGTGMAAQIPGVEIAGKTGTAELVNTATKAASNNPKNTDSWFVAYAPVADPKVAVAALFPGAGYGAATAAPAVKELIEAALAR